ncbi:glycosyltransferase family 2 protein [Formosa algae]|uniref:GT2 family glycosyltransferase n=1 Tax=Formosa algae TaxID=225843 RepID=A0A9X1C8S6_9FLAO|nr:glycosyltransferase family 2 protein [Formosa algae]MBP1839761.1 GT2 family glycosyltransferase [Formosa algae]MDQ0335360.1 GT2 family glycosyltransferase [Formosa algae]OEI79246.1 glycosyl transferase family 2 [Formosa algae]
MKIAIAILNWNGSKLLQQFLPTVIKHAEDAEIYVIDNASTDDSVSVINTLFPTVNIIVNPENGGYAKGYNDGLKHITADVFCLLNSDIEVTPNWLAPIRATFQSEPKTAIIQPKILDYKNKDYFEYAGAAGGFIDKYGYPFCRGRIFNTVEKDEGQYNTTLDIFWATGACLFIRANVFKNINGFDNAFFAHMEEIDLCWRAKNLDYKVKCVPSSEVYHVGGATLNASNPQKTYLNFRNSLFLLVKNAEGNIYTIIVLRMILDGLAGIQFVAQLKFKHFYAIIRAHFSFYGQISRLLKQRQTLAKQPNYFKIRSIVWEYFLKKKKMYKQL